ncbi:MAG: cadherin-like domain-containing protein [Verrucomicrobia bacterium]|nr:cadherin-like domain-containing protein [Verrucomicrobiota bacterium]
MRKQPFWRNLAIAKLGILLGVGGFTTEMQAAHFRYANMAWKPTSNPGEVEFNFQFGVARNTVGSGNAQIGDVVYVDNFFFGDGTHTTLYIKVTALDIAENWIVGEMVVSPQDQVPVRKTYSGPGPFTAGFNSCCRLSSLANRGDGNLLAQSIITPFNGNSSPVSSMVPIVNLPASTNASFFVPAIDPDGDSLRWRVATDLEAVGSSFGNTSPAGITINPTTGQVTWDTSTLDQTRFYTVQFMIEDVDLNGNVKTRSPVDILLKIGAQTGTAPELEVHTTDPGNAHGPLTVVANTLAVLTVEASDIDPNNTLILNAGGLPAGAVMTPQLPLIGSTNVSSTFNWTPTLAQVGTHGITFSVTDETGLQTLGSMTINVISGATTAGNDSYATPKDTALTVPAPGVLANDEDEGNNSLTAVLSSIPKHGTVNLQPDGSFVYTPEAGYTGSDEFRYRAYNGSTYSLFATVTLQITASNAAPTDILLSNNSVAENQAAGTVVGVLSALDEVGDTHTFALVSGAGDTDNASFSISNGSLQTSKALDYEEKSSLSIRVRATDAGGASFEKQLTINVLDVVDGGALFEEAKGIYMGLFNEADEVRHASSGRFYVSITSLGTFSASAVVGGVTRRFSGKMGDLGSVTKTNSTGYVLTMTVDNSTATISGTISSSSWTTELFAYKNLYSKTNPSPFTGVYTLSLENGALTPGTPEGSAVLFMRVKANGRVGIGGFLAEGITARSVSIISPNGQIPVYSALYGKGSLLGWLTLAIDGNVSGDFSLIRLPGSVFFPAGFTNILTSVSSRLNPAAAFPTFSTGDSVFAGGDLLAPLLNPAFKYERRFPKYGRISGTVTHPTTSEAMSVRVVVLQNQNKAIGYWRTSDSVGSVTLLAD